jgi:hypothetical protein
METWTSRSAGAFSTTLLLLVFAIAGCASSSGGAAPNASGNDTQSQGCLQASYTGGSRADRTATLLALSPDPIPVPDDIDVAGQRPTDLNQQDQSTWVDQSKSDAQQNEDNAPPAPQGTPAPNHQNLEAEGDAVAPAEEFTLLIDDYSSGDEVDFGEEVCTAVEKALNTADALDSLKSAEDFISQLTPIPAPSGSGAPSGSSSGMGAEDALKAIVDILKSAGSDFTNVFGPCESEIDVAEWLLETIEEVFCTSEASG